MNLSLRTNHVRSDYIYFDWILFIIKTAWTDLMEQVVAPLN